MQASQSRLLSSSLICLQHPKVSPLRCEINHSQLACSSSINGKLLCLLRCDSNHFLDTIIKCTCRLLECLGKVLIAFELLHSVCHRHQQSALRIGNELLCKRWRTDLRRYQQRVVQSKTREHSMLGTNTTVFREQSTFQITNILKIIRGTRRPAQDAKIRYGTAAFVGVPGLAGELKLVQASQQQDNGLVAVL